ncbi:MAG: RND family transporter, partial [Flavobacteriaceae bacterium]|nr:RND family transporter [Flavobacteriaceae bacterium]
MNIWAAVSRIILKGRIPILIVLALITYFLASQMKYMRLSYTEANLLPKNHEVNVEYDRFLHIFGEEGNIIILAVEDSSIYTSEKFNNWNKLSQTLDTFPEVDFIVSVENIKKLKKDEASKSFITE